MRADRVLLGAGHEQDQTDNGGELHVYDVYDVEALAVKGLLVLAADGVRDAG
jgi:hypothetical protein